MEKLNDILHELGISKVKLAKFLGVSRQMIYNYLELDSLNKWPQEKRLLLLKLLDIEDGSDKAIKSIKVTSEYLENVEARLIQNVKEPKYIKYLRQYLRQNSPWYKTLNRNQSKKYSYIRYWRTW